jgi:hypothetical protein
MANGRHKPLLGVLRGHRGGGIDLSFVRAADQSETAQGATWGAAHFQGTAFPGIDLAAGLNRQIPDQSRLVIPDPHFDANAVSANLR